MRLTKRMSSISYAVCGNVILSKCENCNSRMPSCYEEDCGVNVEALKRLAAYEDSGLSPEEVQELAKAKASVWIPVTERLPKTNKTYVICTDGTRVRELFYCDKRFLSGVLDQTNQVAHWMPLPPCPEAAEKAIAEVMEE